MPDYKLSYGDGVTKVLLEASFLGKDLQVSLSAGKAHIGAIALAIPCAANAEGVTASCSVMTVPGHRDNIPAERAALLLCKALQRPVSVVVGLHIDRATQEEIITLVDNSTHVVENLIKIMRGL